MKFKCLKTALEGYFIFVWRKPLFEQISWLPDKFLSYKCPRTYEFWNKINYFSLVWIIPKKLIFGICTRWLQNIANPDEIFDNLYEYQGYLWLPNLFVHTDFRLSFWKYFGMAWDYGFFFEVYLLLNYPVPTIYDFKRIKKKSQRL